MHCLCVCPARGRFRRQIRRGEEAWLGPLQHCVDGTGRPTYFIHRTQGNTSSNPFRLSLGDNLVQAVYQRLVAFKTAFGLVFEERAPSLQ